jgi:transposase
MRFDLSDEEWSALEPLLPAQRKTARVNDRRIINAILHVLRTGMPWRDLPERYGPYTTAYNRFNRWSRRGIWKRIFEQFAAKSRDGLLFIDSTVVKAHRSASGGKGGNANKESVSVAAAGVRKSMRRSTENAARSTLS